MPKPDQIVPWNADPMVISDPVTQPEARYSTLVMLRYDKRLKNVDDLQISDKNNRTFKPQVKTFKSGAEVLLAVLLLVDDKKHATHAEASASYDAMVKLISNFNSHLQFLDPPTPDWPMRNTPLDVEKLPYDISAHLTQYTDTDLQQVTALSDPKNKVPFFPHANCKAPILRVKGAK
jgi:hypothetical protein